MKNYSYDFEVRPITPFHIGNGEEHDPLSLVIKNSQAYMLNQLEFIKYLLEADPRVSNKRYPRQVTKGFINISARPLIRRGSNATITPIRFGPGLKPIITASWII